MAEAQPSGFPGIVLGKAEGWDSPTARAASGGINRGAFERK